MSTRPRSSARLRRATPPLMILAALGLGAYLIWGGFEEPTKQRDYPLPPISKSEFLNTSLKVQYVGTDACIECHDDQHESYQRTAHSRAFRETDPTAEPQGDAEFHHVASGRSYRVYRRDDQLRHRESISRPGAEPLVLSDYPVKYTIGSGAFARSYLIQIGDFLVQSPISWYKQANKWDLSPGYDRPDHFSFTRLIDDTCLTCHTGRVEADQTAGPMVKIHEAAIGCEACHGPGSLHVESRRADEEVVGEVDRTIVNPRHLPRELKEAICASCHLQGVVTIGVRGRRFSFRPGLPLQEYRVTYVDDSPAMSVTGHVEQMHRSACYQGSGTFTCLTCHNPHDQQRSAPQRVEHYRSICLSCHALEACGLDVAERHRRSPGDNCIRCHMPQSPVEAPHTTFTHHRVAVHKTTADPANSAEKDGPTSLRPFYDLSGLPDIDRDRCLGLAFAELSQRRSSLLGYHDRARKTLHEVRQRGLRDARVDAWLARLYRADDPQQAAAWARSALESKSLSSGTRLMALGTLSANYFESNQLDQAGEVLEKLVGLHRSAEAWFQLAICRVGAGDLQGAAEALEQVIAIEPLHLNAHARLAELYEQTGRALKSETQRRRERHFAKPFSPKNNVNRR